MNKTLPLSPLAPDCLQKKVILLLGATGDMGSAVAKHLISHQAEVILASRNLKKLEKLYDELENLGPEPALHAMNLMNVGIKEAEELCKHIDSLYGRLDGVIFCTGRWGQLTPIEHYPESQWLEIMHLNLNVPFLITRALMPLLRKTKDSTVLFTESPLSQTTKAYHGAFNCSQSALHTLMQMLQLENPASSMRFVGVNVKCLQSKTRRQLYPADPAPEEGLTPAEVAPVYTHLLGELGEKFKGQTFHVANNEEQHASADTKSLTGKG